MKTYKIILAICLFWIWNQSSGQTIENRAKTEISDFNEPSAIRKSFANPTVPGTLVIENYEGDIQIMGYQGRDVLIEARLQPGNQTQSAFSLEQDRPFTLEEKNNTMSIQAKPSFYGLSPHIDFKVKVPEKTTIKVKILKAGNLETSRTSRLVEVDNQNGFVTLTELRGWAIVNTVNGDIKANFSEVIDNKTMSFISLNGDIYLDLPKDLKADFRMKTTTGMIENEFATPQPQIEQTQLDENNLNEQGANLYRPNEYSLNQKEKDDLSDQKEKVDTQDKKLDLKPSGEVKKQVQKPAKINPDSPKSVANQQSRKVYVAPMSFQAQSNGGGPVYFISARNGQIQINKNKNKNK
ncbi:MAG: DUF4097 family beta strand repeat-containing protein [Microscillaceae bacterium]|nr:DUF4097 family beta strand repeat-containing protein [Microscillaceae bacterium]